MTTEWERDAYEDARREHAVAIDLARDALLVCFREILHVSDPTARHAACNRFSTLFIELSHLLDEDEAAREGVELWNIPR